MSVAAALDAPPAPSPSPLVGQLAALHHFRVYVDIAVVVVVLALSNLLAHFTTPWANIAVVPAAVLGLIVLVRARGLDWTDLGLGREHWRSGVGYALGAFGLVGTVIAVGALLPWTRPMFLNNHYATLSGALLASMVIIPLKTVIPEERRLHPGARWRDVRHDRRCRRRRAGHRRGRIRLHLAAPPQRQPDRPHCAALVTERAGRTGGRRRLAPVGLSLRRPQRER